MRATVCFAPIRFARKQLSMFISSEPVAAMKSSALSAPASDRVLKCVPAAVGVNNNDLMSLAYKALQNALANFTAADYNDFHKSRLV